jgi:DNA mismatch endonuclease (patch repair protein)
MFFVLEMMILSDVHSAKTRSYNMSKIKGKATKPEILVRKYLFSKGFRYRVNDRRYPGNPDIVLPKYKVVIFVNGCFWHVHEGCKYFVWPENNKSFWKTKLSSNVERDRKNYEKLVSAGWKVIIIWECELQKGKGETRLEQLMQEIHLPM